MLLPSLLFENDHLINCLQGRDDWGWNGIIFKDPWQFIRFFLTFTKHQNKARLGRLLNDKCKYTPVSQTKSLITSNTRYVPIVDRSKDETKTLAKHFGHSSDLDFSGISHWPPEMWMCILLAILMHTKDLDRGSLKFSPGSHESSLRWREVSFLSTLVSKLTELVTPESYWWIFCSL